VVCYLYGLVQDDSLRVSIGTDLGCTSIGFIGVALADLVGGMNEQQGVVTNVLSQMATTSGFNLP
jgi:hypothetical protein